MLDRYYWPWEAKLGGKARMCFSHDLSKIMFPVRKYRGSATKPDDKIFPILRDARFLPYEQPESYDHAHWQPCYSGRESADEAVKNLIAYLRQNPRTKSLGLGINDNGGFCECAACLKLDGGGKALVQEADYEANKTAIQEAIDSCPVNAISLGE